MKIDNVTDAIELDGQNQCMDHVLYFDPATREWSMSSYFSHERFCAPEAVWAGRVLCARVRWGTSTDSIRQFVKDCPVDTVADGHRIDRDDKGHLSDDASEAWDTWSDELYSHEPEFSRMDADEFFADATCLRAVYKRDGRDDMIAEMQVLATYERVVCTGIEEHADALIDSWT
jgi:hypothetical protein